MDEIASEAMASKSLERCLRYSPVHSHLTGPSVGECWISSKLFDVASPEVDECRSALVIILAPRRVRLLLSVGIQRLAISASLFAGAVRPD